MNNPLAILNYEIQMYLGARHLQGFAPSNQLALQLQECAVTEVKAIHIRILMEILLERNSKEPDNINIEDIFPDWRKNNPVILHNLKNAYTKRLKNGYNSKTCLNKFLFHPDKRRGSRFNWAPIVIIMDPPLKEAFRTLPKIKFDALQIFSKYL